MIPSKYIPIFSTLAVCVILYLAGAILYPEFLSAQVVANFFIGNSVLGIVAIGMTFVILSGGIDLSVGSVMALSSVIVAVLIREYNFPVPLAILASLAAGSLFGCLMGTCVITFGIAPFIVTLAGMYLARGLTFLIRMESVPIENPLHLQISGWSFQPVAGLTIPITVIVFMFVMIVAVLVSIYTKFGRNVYAVGGNEDAALLMGLPIGRTKVLVYTISGFCSALAGVVFTFYASNGNPSAGLGTELDAIAVVVIGGTLLSGGVGYVFGTLVGVAIFGIIRTGLNFQEGISSWWLKIIIGILLLFFILLQKFLARGSETKH